MSLNNFSNKLNSLPCVENTIYYENEEYDALMDISNNNKYSEYIRNFCEVIPQVMQELCFETEREEYLENIN